MLILIPSCKDGGKSEISNSSDICEGSHLIYIDKNRKDREFTLYNNKYACEQCKSYLSNEEQEICEVE